MLGVWNFFATRADDNDFVKLLPGAMVTVRRESDGGLAELETGPDPDSPGLDNPFTVGSDGEIIFYADQSDRYRIDITLNGDTLTLRDQSVSVKMSSLMSQVLQSTTIAAIGAMGMPLNFALSASVGSNALTMAVKGANGSDPSASNPVYVPFRSSTQSSGSVVWRTVSSALSLVISSGSTLGHNSALKQYIYWYLIDNAGVAELAASSKFFGHHGIVSTTAEGAAGAADSGTVMYSTTARTSVPFVCVGYSEDTQATAGTWATAPSAVHLAPFAHPLISFSAHKNGSNQGSVANAFATKVTFGTEIFDNGGLFDSATNHRWVPPPGSVHITGSVQVTLAVDQMYLLALLEKNGSIFKRVDVRASGGFPVSVPIDIKDECNGTDYYELFVQHDAGSDRTLDGGTSVTYFMGSWSPQRS